MSSQPAQGVTPGVLQNIESVAQLEQQFRRQRSHLDRLTDAVSGFAGSVRFIVLHGVLFGLWVMWNLAVPE